MRDEVTGILRRVRQLDDALRRATLNDLRVLERRRYALLQRLVGTLEAPEGADDPTE